MKDDTPPMCAGCQRAEVRPGYDMETSAEDTIDLMAFCDAVLRRVLERVRKGEIEPGFDDLRMIVAIQEKFAAATANDFDLAAITESYGIFFGIVLEIMTPEQSALFGQKMSRYPLLAGLKTRSEAQQRAYKERIRAEVFAEIETGSAPSANGSVPVIDEESTGAHRPETGR
jgi:hypothetical protein